MKVTVQSKIAELESRILALEDESKARLASLNRATRHATVTTTTTTTAPITPAQQGHVEEMWSHFNKVFDLLGKVFR